MMLTYGSPDIGVAVGTRYFSPWITTISLLPIGCKIPFDLTLSQMYVKQNSPVAPGFTADYRVRVNGVDVLMVNGVASDASEASNLVDDFSVSKGDLLEVVVVVPVILVSGLLRPWISIKAT